MSDESNEARQNFLSNVISGLVQQMSANNALLSLGSRYTHQFEHPRYRVNMPSPIRCESLSRRTDLSGHTELKLVVGDFEESQQLPRKNSHIRFVDESI